MGDRPPEQTDAPQAAVLPGTTTFQVAFRFALRAVILAVFSTLGAKGFAQTFADLLTLGASYCGCVAAFRREWPNGPALTHWDEAAGYLLLASLALALR
jgi:hypothetical protein